MKNTIDLNSKKNGRPLLKEEDKKSEIIKVRVTKKEKKKVEKLLKKSNYRSISHMVREIVLEGRYKIVELDPEGSRKKMLLVSQAKAIGINFNQVVKMLNSKNTSYFTKNEKEKLLNQVDIIQQILLKIHREFF